MLTAIQAFQGDDVSHVMASVMKLEPDFSRLPANLNPRFYELPRRCVAKNRKDGWHAIGDVRVELQTFPVSLAQSSLSFLRMVNGSVFSLSRIAR